MSGEWNACETWSRVDPHATRPPASPTTASSASRCPEITTRRGPLSAAMDSESVHGAMASRTSASSANTAAMPPLRGSSCMRRPRASTTAQGVGQRQHPGDVRRGQLADAVADHRGRLDAPAPPQRGHGDLVGEERRLGAAGVVDRQPVGSGAVAEHDREEVEAATSRRISADCVEGVAERRLGLRTAAGPCPAIWLPWPVNSITTPSSRAGRRPDGIGREGPGRPRQPGAAAASAEVAATTARRSVRWARPVVAVAAADAQASVGASADAAAWAAASLRRGRCRSAAETGYTRHAP